MQLSVEKLEKRIASVRQRTNALNLVAELNGRIIEKAIHLYKKFGFTAEGVIKRDFLIDDVFYDSIAMGLLID
ncbi:MAG: hypothetical protein ABF586_07065 [Sporolactobacillus sp.]